MMRTSLLPLIAVLALPAMLGGCGLTPLYEGGRSSPAAQRLASVEVALIPGKPGWLVRNAITQQLSAVTKGTPQYRLTVALDDKIEGLGVRANDNVTRERRTLRARFQLRKIDAAPDSPPILDETESADVGLDVTSSEYATVAAEDTALERLAETLADRIVTRVAIDARRK